MRMLLQWLRQLRCEHYSTLGTEERIVAGGRFKERIRTCVKCHKEWSVRSPIWPDAMLQQFRGRPSDIPPRHHLDGRLLEPRIPQPRPRR